MSETRRVDLGLPSLLELRGPDAVRFLNGQLTQDVRKLSGGKVALPACVTDAKGKLQFRVTVTALDDGSLWISGPAERSEEIEARITRYLIADDVESHDLTGTHSLSHFIGAPSRIPLGVVARASNRYGVAGTDWWIPVGDAIEFPAGFPLIEGDELEALRISNGIPIWGRELNEGMLPPEALLELTDISYSKGCYIGQEVISRVKSAGKVNKKLTRFLLDASASIEPGPLEDNAGTITSISPIADGAIRHALGYVKRGAGDLRVKAADGSVLTVTVSE